LNAARVALNWQYEVQHVETAVNLVEAGLGYAIVPSIDVTLHRGRGVVAIPLRAPRLSCTYGLVTRRGMPLSPSAAGLRTFVVEEMKAKGRRHASDA
jgi:DNA-binding transcriptional LysR family regulator